MSIMLLTVWMHNLIYQSLVRDAHMPLVSLRLLMISYTCLFTYSSILLENGFTTLSDVVTRLSLFSVSSLLVVYTS